jgi:hypothetical protein
LEGSKATTGSTHVVSGGNALKTSLLAVTLQFDGTTVRAKRTEKKNTVLSGISTVKRMTFATLTWCLLCHNLITAIPLARLLRLSGVTYQ